MRVSYKHRFIFIHVDRTGGTSVSRALDPLSYKMSDVERVVAAIARRIGLRVDSYRWRKFKTQHVTARELQETFPESVFESYFKFAFVRNPWDWVVSLYFARLQSPWHPEYELARYLGSFPRYLRWWASERRFLQRDYLCDENGRFLVDFVGRFEAIDSHFAEACRRIGIVAQLPHENAGRGREGRDYRSFYDEHSRGIVAEACADDISQFGYEFGSTREAADQPIDLGRDLSSRVRSQ